MFSESEKRTFGSSLMTWIAPTPSARRAQFGRFLLGTGGIGGVATLVGPGIGLDDQEGLDLIDRAVGEGFKILDTADIYTGGNSERVVGVWNRAHPGSDVLIQTKTGFTPNGPDLSPDRLRRQLRHSIDTIGRVDLYIAHTVDPRTPWQDSLPVFHEAIAAGTIRAYGLSNVDEAALTSALSTADRLGLARPEIVQNSYSLLLRDDEKGVLPLVESEGLAYTPYSPLANGILAGRYSQGQQPAHGSRASTGPRAQGLLDDPHLMKAVQRFDRLAADQGVSPAGLALAWLINQPPVTAPIVGLSKESHWQGLHEATQLAWTPALESAVDAAFA
jgi:1-deoxyxylulose-5-phosphate synthase